MLYDAIVLGTGGVGSAALWQLASRGARVLGIDRFSPGHDRGSSHGETRIIRLAYFEHPDYVPLLRRAYQLWHQIERESRQPLFHQVGLLQVGPTTGEVVPGVLASAKQHGLDVETLSPAEAMRRFPAFSIEPGDTAVFEPTAGYLRVESCVRTCFDLARQAGAEFAQAAIHSWQATSDECQVETDQGTFRARQLVISPGPWAGQLLPELASRFVVRRKPLYWFETDEPRFSAMAGCPTFLFERPHGVFYGFPSIDPLGIKVAEHTGGKVVTDPLREQRSDVIDAQDLSRVWNFVQQSLPGTTAHVSRHSACFYTMSPDGHFVVDRLPGHEKAAFCAGLSGHGFKFVPVLGQILADLILDGGTDLPAGFLNAGRLA